LLNKAEHRPILFRQKKFQKIGLYESNTLLLRQCPESVFPVTKLLLFSVLALYANLLAILMPELCRLDIFLYVTESEPLTLLYAHGLPAYEYSVNSKNSISGYGLTYDTAGLKTPSRMGGLPFKIQTPGVYAAKTHEQFAHFVMIEFHGHKHFSPQSACIPDGRPSSQPHR
jgi:hypothetical protein